MVKMNCIFRRQIVFALLVMLCVFSAKAGSTKTGLIVVELKEAGTLSTQIDDSKKYMVDSLKVIGDINGTDLKLIREMAGRDSKGSYTKGDLGMLDLSEARIVSGGECYFDDYKTSDDCLGDYAFQKCNMLQSVVLPSGLKTIGTCAFGYCIYLTDLQIPSGVTTIGNSVFSGCSRLKSMVIPSSVTSLGESAFHSCTGLESVQLPDGLTSIGKTTFNACSQLVNIQLPSGITSIGQGAFKGCSHMTSLTLPSSLTSMGDDAFYGCERLESIELPLGLTVVPLEAFYGCKGLKSVAFPAGFTKIGENAFHDCASLEALDFPSSLTTIGYNAFYGCTSLTSLVIPSAVTSIENYAFFGCTGLTSVYVAWNTPLTVDASSFNKVDREKCTLYVPEGTSGEYTKASVWSSFTNIKEYTPTGIAGPVLSADAKEVCRYSLNGQQLSAPAKGINIVKYSDGSVRKIAR